MARSTHAVLLAASLLVAAQLDAQEQEATAEEGWVALPGEEDTSARAFAVVRNPSMYDVYLVSASSPIAAQVEFRDASGAAVRELTVPAYGRLSMEPGDAHMVLVDLERPLEAGDTVPLTLTTDSAVKLQIEAVVREE